MTTTQLKGNVQLCETSSTVLTIYKPITFGWTSIPTSGTQLGWSFTSTQVSTTTISNTTFLGTISIAQAGCYMIFVNAQVQNNVAGVVTSAFISVNGTSIGLGVVYGGSFQNATLTYPVMSNGGYSFNVNMTVATPSIANINTAYLVYSYMRVG